MHRPCPKSTTKELATAQEPKPAAPEPPPTQTDAVLLARGARQLFGQFDANNDGTLNAKELSQVSASFLHVFNIIMFVWVANVRPHTYLLL